MREIDELYADSGEPVKESRGVSRGTALKVGGLGLAGALAAFVPGRAGAVVRRKASNSSCQGTGFDCIGSNKAKACGYDDNSIGTCFCATIFYGKLKHPGSPVGACVENAYCALSASCASQKDCGAGYVCTTATCCQTIFGYPNLCFHYCEQGSQGNAPKLNTPHPAAHK